MFKFKFKFIVLDNNFWIVKLKRINRMSEEFCVGCSSWINRECSISPFIKDNICLFEFYSVVRSTSDKKYQYQYQEHVIKEV